MTEFQHRSINDLQKCSDWNWSMYTDRQISSCLYFISPYLLKKFRVICSQKDGINDKYWQKEKKNEKINLLSYAIHDVQNLFNFLWKISSKSKESDVKLSPPPPPSFHDNSSLILFYVNSCPHPSPSLLYFEANSYHISSSVNVLVYISKR